MYICKMEWPHTNVRCSYLRLELELYFVDPHSQQELNYSVIMVKKNACSTSWEMP